MVNIDKIKRDENLKAKALSGSEILDAWVGQDGYIIFTTTKGYGEKLVWTVMCDPEGNGPGCLHVHVVD